MNDYELLAENRIEELYNKLDTIGKLLPELAEILNMEWIWLSRKPLHKLLKWDEKLREVLGDEFVVREEE